MNGAQLSAWMTTHQKQLMAGGAAAVAGAAVYVRHKQSATGSSGTGTGTAATGVTGTTLSGSVGSAGLDGDGGDPIIVQGQTGPAGPAGPRGATGAPGKPAAPPKGSPKPKPKPTPPKSKPAPRPSGNYRTYRVGKGGTLYGAAQSIFGTRTPSQTDLKRLAAANNVKLTSRGGHLYASVHAGQVLRYPEPAKKK